jgi:hypothetical protein
MIGLGLDPCQEQLFTPFPAVLVLWTRKPSGMRAVCSPPASRWRQFALKMLHCTD